MQQQQTLEQEVAEAFPNFNPKAKFYRIYRKKQAISLEDEVCYTDPATEAQSRIDSYGVDIYEKEVLERFTGTKKTIIELIFRGYNFNQIAKQLNLTVTESYRIREQIGHELNLPNHHKEPKKILFLRRMIFLYLLIHPNITAIELYEHWGTDKVTKEYARPPYNIVDDEVSNFVEVFRKR